MSRDFRLTWRCTHLTIEEVVEVDDDKRTLRGAQTIGGTNTVRVMVNDELVIPQSGLYASAQLYSTTSGPFDIDPSTDVLIITTSSEEITVDLDVATILRVDTDEIVRQIRLRDPQSLIAENINGHLVLTDYSRVGPESVVTVRGTGALALGFGSTGDSCGRTSPRQMSARGRKLYPGWEILSQYPEGLEDILDQIAPDVLEDTIQRHVRFREPLRGNPMIKLTYSAPQHGCLRCGQFGVENDIRFDATGQQIFLENEDLLHQGALKIVLTERGSNPYHPWYGTKISSRIGQKILAGVTALINEDVRQALARFQALQGEQGLYQTVTSKERLYRVISVQGFRPEGDPTTILVESVIQNAAAEPITLTSLFTVPNVIALIEASNSSLASPNAAAVGL